MAERSTGRNPGATNLTTGKGGMQMKPIRVTREYFVSDADLARFLGLSKDQVIVEVTRRSAKYNGEVVTFGTIVQVVDTDAGANGAR